VNRAPYANRRDREHNNKLKIVRETNEKESYFYALNSASKTVRCSPEF